MMIGVDIGISSLSLHNWYINGKILENNSEIYNYFNLSTIIRVK